MKTVQVAARFRSDDEEAAKTAQNLLGEGGLVQLHVDEKTIQIRSNTETEDEDIFGIVVQAVREMGSTAASCALDYPYELGVQVEELINDNGVWVTRGLNFGKVIDL